jgi:uncharacterized protein DUF4337
LGEFKPHEEVAETAERSEGRRGARWTPIAAAIVAVLAALANLASNQRSTEALIAKNESIAALTHASDTYNYYQAKSIKEELYKAAIVTGGKKLPALQKVVDHEHSSKQPILGKARDYDKQAAEANERSERFLHSHDTLEIGVTFLEVAIVVLSISALVGTLALPIIAGVATVVGVGFAAAGLPL